MASSLRTELARLAAPMAALQVVGALAALGQTALVGRMQDGEGALIALGYASQLVAFFGVIPAGVVIGTVALVARFEPGSADAAHAANVARRGAIVGGAGLAFIGAPLVSVALRTLGADEASAEAGGPYALVAIFSTPVAAWAGALTGAHIARKDARTPLLAAALGTGVALLISAALLFGGVATPPPGIAAVAWGALAGHLVQIGLLERSEASSRNGSPASDGDAPLSLRKLYTIAAPAMLDLGVVALSFAVMVRVLASLSPAAVAAHGIGLRLHAILLVPLLALSRAEAALVGNALRDDDARQVDALLRETARLGALLLAPLLLSLAIWPELALPFFDLGEQSPLAEPTRLWIRILALSTPGLGLHFAFTGVFRGAGATSISLAINLATTLGLQIPLTFALSSEALGLGAWGVWLALPAALVARLALDIVAYRASSWRRP